MTPARPAPLGLSAEDWRQVGIAAFGLPALVLTQAGELWAWWGSLLGLAGQPLWLMATFRAGQRGMWWVSWAYTLVWAWGVWRHCPWRA